MQTGVKNDQGKTQWWYFDNFWPQLEQVVQVLEMGDRKYPAEDGSNWKRVDNANQRYKDAMFRHMVAYRTGQRDDPESGKSHLAHVITNALFLMYNDSVEEEVEYYHQPTLESIQEIVKDALDNCTTYSAPRSDEYDRQIIAPHLEAILDEIEYRKSKND